MFILLVVVVLVVILGVLTAFVVPQQSVYIIESFGKFSRAETAGLHFKIPVVEMVAGKVSLRVRQLDNVISTKTRDNVFVEAEVSVQYQVSPRRADDAFYKLENPDAQIRSYVEDAIRSAVPKLDLDDAYDRKDDVAREALSIISDAMGNYGYEVLSVLVTSIEPDASIREAMNSINEANRRREAAKAQAEADRIVTVTKAQAEAEKMRLRGEGIAQQRQAIVKGLSESMAQLRDSGLSDSQVMSVLLINQYIDSLNNFASGEGTHTVFLPISPDGIEGIRADVISSLDAAGVSRSFANPVQRKPMTGNATTVRQPASTSTGVSGASAQHQQQRAGSVSPNMRSSSSKR